MEQFDSSKVIDRRYDVVFIDYSKLSNGNGDPDNDNMQRVDPATGNGIKTPGCFKSWGRATAQLHGEEVYIARGGLPLSTKMKEACGDLYSDTKGAKGKGSKGDKDSDKMSSREVKEAAVKMMAKYIDVRWFGGALTKPINEQVTGPIQVCFGETVEPVEIMNLSITRGAVSKEEDIDKERTMGKIPVISFGLFRTNIHVNPFCAARVGTTYGDLAKFFQYSIESFDLFRSTTRSNNHFHKMIIFRHPDANGKESAASLMRRVKITRKNPNGRELPPPSSADDYNITIETAGLSEKGIEFEVVDG
jgi:CRISPR-associated protein Csd2